MLILDRSVGCLRCQRELSDPFSPCLACLADGVAVNGTPRAEADVSVPAGTASPPTPLRRLERLGTAYGARLWMKDERTGPTCSYKDRLARAAVAHARRVGAETVVVASSGNHGAAVAAAATAAGMSSVVVTTTSIAPAMRRLIEGCGATLIPVERAEDRWTLVAAAVTELGWYPAGNFHGPPIGSNPFAVDGYAQIAREIVEQLGGAPDWVAVPVGYGDGLAGIGRGFRALAHAGVIERPSRMLAVETTGTLADALVRGADQPLPMAVAAPSALSIACPQGTFQALHAVRVSGGAAITVDDAAALEARARLSSLEGSFHELSSAAAFAGVGAAVHRGIVGPDDRVVAIGTSVGLKDQPLSGDDRPLTPVAPTLAAMREVVPAPAHR